MATPSTVDSGSLADVCGTCGQTRLWHKTNQTRHVFDAAPGSLNQKEKLRPAPAAVGVGMGGDPALRLALINAGVITYGQLATAEEELRGARNSGTPVFARPPDASAGPGVSDDGRSSVEDLGPRNRGGA